MRGRTGYLRYQPAAQRFLQLGDFGFQRFAIHKIYVVGGFAQASWLDAERFIGIPVFTPETEQAMIEPVRSILPEAVRLLGIDTLGIDLLVDAQRQRIALPKGAVSHESVLGVLQIALDK